MSSVNDTGWRGMMHFAIPVALPEGTDPEEFGEELALVIEWGLAGGIGNGSEALTGDCRLRIARASWLVGLSVREYREIEAGHEGPGRGHLRARLQAVRLAADVHGRTSVSGGRGLRI